MPVVRFLLHVLKELYGLIVEDEFVAIGALASIGLGYVLSRDGVLGARLGVAAALFGLFAATLCGSLARAAVAARRASR